VANPNRYISHLYSLGIMDQLQGSIVLLSGVCKLLLTRLPPRPSLGIMDQFKTIALTSMMLITCSFLYILISIDNIYRNYGLNG